MDIIQVGLLGITAVFLALFIKNYKSEYSILISIVACICIFIFLIGKLELVLSYINSVVELIPVDGRYLAMILKMIGITYVAEFATDICRESGYQAIAGQIEIFAKLSILLISMPVLMGFIETLGAFYEETTIKNAFKMPVRTAGCFIIFFHVLAHARRTCTGIFRIGSIR